MRIYTLEVKVMRDDDPMNNNLVKLTYGKEQKRLIYIIPSLDDLPHYINEIIDIIDEVEQK